MTLLFIDEFDFFLSVDESCEEVKSVNDLPPVLLKATDSLYEDRIKLDPLQEDGGELQPKLPSPHMSAPILPPIRPRPSVALKVEGQPNPNSVAAISQNLSSMRFSAASFPDETPSFESLKLELPKDI